MIRQGLTDESLSEAVLYFLASTGTTARVIPHAVAEVSSWLDRTSEEKTVLADPAFLNAVAAESLRLHPSTPAIFRRAIVTGRLPSGLAVGRGALLRLDVHAANRERAVWGDDADRFDPRRTVPPGYRPWGFAFGAGSHLCIGQPAATGSRGPEDGGVDGLIARVLEPLYAAHVALDTERQPQRYRIGHFEAYGSFPVRLRMAS
jgi:cytochrome P450